MKKGSSNRDQLAAYYLARLLDIELGKLFKDNANTVCYESIQNCQRIAELNFEKVDLDKFIEEFVNNEWSLDYIYLDRKQNQYDFKLELVHEVHEVQDNNS